MAAFCRRLNPPAGIELLEGFCDRDVCAHSRIKMAGSELDAKLWVKFVDALYDMGRIFEQPSVVRDKQFRFHPTPVITKSQPLT